MRAGAYLREDAILLTGRLAPLHRAPDAIVAPLHQPPLQLDRIPQVPVVLIAAALPARQRLQLGVELGVPALGEQQEQV